VSQDLKTKVLRTVADDVLVATIMCRHPVMAPVARGAAIGLLASQGASVGCNLAGGEGISATHLEVLQCRADGREVLGYLLRVPYSDTLFSGAGPGKLNAIEVRCVLWPQASYRLAHLLASRWLGNAVRDR
jgi:hypothetical protein